MVSNVGGSQNEWNSGTNERAINVNNKGGTTTIVGLVERQNFEILDFQIGKNTLSKQSFELND